MLSLFKRESSPPLPERAVRMSLEERMTWRREMLYRCVREQMLELEVLSGMYKFRAQPLDERQHRFALMVDVTQDFRAQRDGGLLGFQAIESVLRLRCLQRHGLGVDAVYWRVHACAAPFEHQRRSGDAPGTRPVCAPGASRRLSRLPEGEGAVADEAQRAFEAAVRRGQRPPPLQVGEQSYQSDLAPLESSARGGGTQYGGL